MERTFVVSLARFHRSEERVYVLQGYFQGNSIAGSRITAFSGQESLPVELTVREGLAVRQKYFSRGIGYENIDREYDLWITLPDHYENCPPLKVYQQLEGKTKCIFRSSMRQLAKQRRMPDGYLETFHEQDGKISIGGWAVGNSPCRIQVTDSKGQKLPAEVTWHYRQDLIDNYPELEGETSLGYEVTFQRPETDKVRLIVAADGQRAVYPIRLSRGLKGLQGRGTGLFAKVSAYFKRNGFKRTVKRVFEKLSEKMTGQQEGYMAWRKRYEPSREELEAQSKNVFLRQPLVSIVVPLYKTPENFLKELVRSLQEQTYRNWQLCLSDGSGQDSPLTGILEQLQRQEKRIRVISSGQQLDIAQNTNQAISIASGEYIAFMDHDDLLTPDALYECVRRINQEPEIDLLYSDEDKVSTDGKEYFEPHFKSDFNIDLLCSMNYFCHLVVIARSLLDRCGLLDSAYNGAQDYDLVLRASEKAEKICHIPKVLYHWRCHKDSTSENPQSKMYAFEAGMRAVQAHYDRLGIPAKVLMGEYPGLYRTHYQWPEERADQPLVSIIIPNKDHVRDLDQCIRSIREQASWPNYEILVVENNSIEEETFAYYKDLQVLDPHTRVLHWKEGFNFSAINNFGVSQARGEYILLLNNDTKMIGADCLHQLMGPMLRPEVGIVGARLYYPDDTIQHAGVYIGFGGIAGHAFINFPRTANGYFSRIICQQDLSAVTAACMMVRRSVYEAVGGLDETLKVAFNDIDFCLKVRQAGYLVVYDPYAQLYHYESKSRGYEDTAGKIARFNQEADRFLKKWPQILKNGDPYYNPNLSLDRVDFGLKR